MRKKSFKGQWKAIELMTSKSFTKSRVNVTVPVSTGVIFLANPTMDETVDFRHPYWDFKISELTEGDMENTKRSIQEQQDKEMRYRGIMVSP